MPDALAFRRALLRLLALLCALACAAAPARAQSGPYRWMQDNLPNLQEGGAAWADVDGDGDQDLLLTGNAGSLGSALPRANLYLNEGDRSFAGPRGQIVHLAEYALAPVALSPRYRGTARFADYDLDGRPDLCVMGGLDGRSNTVEIFRNLGGRWEARPAYSLPGLSSGDAAWGDYDNDGDPDLAIMGRDDAGAHRTILYENRAPQGGGFAAAAVGLPGLAYGSLDWGDYDNDGDLDLLVAGVTAPQAFVARIYRNDGGVFALVEGPFEGLLYASAVWGDYDADGDLDVLLTGARLGPFLARPVARVYENAPGGFREGYAFPEGVFYGGAAWGDYDHDGLLDALLVGGLRLGETGAGRLHRNTGAGAFAEGPGLRGGLYGSALMGDYDGDLDLDLLTTGEFVPDTTGTFLFRNEAARPNTRPAPPGGLAAAVAGRDAALTWAAASDAETPAAGLTYDVHVYDRAGRYVARAPAAATGERWESRRGRVGGGRRLALRGLAPGQYFFTVQSVDNSYAGSAFAPAVGFSVE